jgi:hypothetical protein
MKLRQVFTHSLAGFTNPALERPPLQLAATVARINTYR